MALTPLTSEEVKLYDSLGSNEMQRRGRADLLPSAFVEIPNGTIWTRGELLPPSAFIGAPYGTIWTRGDTGQSSFHQRTHPLAHSAS